MKLLPRGLASGSLFDVKKDPGETEDLSAIDLEKMIQLLKAWDQYVLDSQVVWGGPSGAGEMVELDETADAKAWMEARGTEATASVVEFISPYKGYHREMQIAFSSREIQLAYDPAHVLGEAFMSWLRCAGAPETHLQQVPTARPASV